MSHFSHISGSDAGSVKLAAHRFFLDVAEWLSVLLNRRACQWAVCLSAGILLIALVRHPGPAIALWNQVQALAPVPVTFVPNSHSVPVHFL